MKSLVGRVLISVLALFFLIGQVNAATNARAEFTYGIVGEYTNNAHQPKNIQTLSSLSISKITLVADTDDGTFGGSTQGNDTDVIATITYTDDTTETFSAAINWRENDNDGTHAIGIILAPGETTNDGYSLTNGYDKTYLLRLSGSIKTYTNDKSAQGNAATGQLSAIMEELNTEAATQGTAGGTFDPSKVTITANPTSVVADGSTTSTVTVQMKNSAGNNIAATGETVTLSSTLGILSSVTDNNDGTYTATITSNTAGSATISGAVGGSSISDTAGVTFTSLSTPTYSIAGTVTRGNSSNGIANVTVNLYAATDTSFSTILQSDTTDNNGDYAFTGVVDGAYSVEFVSTTSSKFKAKTNNGKNGSNSSASSKDVNKVESIVVNGSNLDDVDAILIDPAGVIYDSSTRSAVSGAVVKFYYDNNGTQTIVPDSWLDQDAGGPNTQTTASDGIYSFVLNGNAPTTTTTYTIDVTPPNGYTFESTIIPQTSASPYDPGLGGGIVEIQPQTTAPQDGELTTYYLNFDLVIGTNLATSSNGVINNHIPIDPVPNQAPNATAQSALAVSFNTPLTITLSGTDADSDPLTYAIASQPSNGSLSAITNTNEVTYTPGPNYSGNDSFTFTVTDATGSNTTSSAATITLVVASSNNVIASAEFTCGVVGEYTTGGPAQQLTRIETFNNLNIDSVTLEPISTDGTFAGTQGNDYAVFATVNFSDNSSETFQGAVNWREGNTNAIGIITTESVNDGFTLTAGSSKTYLLCLDDAPAANVNYQTVSDINGNAASAGTLTEVDGQAEQQGTAGGVLDLTNTTITANPTSVVADGSTTSTITVSIKDSSGKELNAFGKTVVLTTDFGTLSTVTDNGDGTYTATITSSSVGVATISGTVDGLAITDTATVTFTAIPSSNTAPVATPQSVTTPEDTAKVITLAGTDADGDSLTYTSVSTPSNGTLSGTAPNLTYTPNDDYTGSDSFTFSVNDGTENSATNGTVNITVTPVNDGPSAESFTVVTDEESPIVITFRGSDPENDPLTFEATSTPDNGSLTCSDGVCTYTPVEEFDGEDSFTYIAKDADTYSEPATITVVVNDTIAENSPPVAVDDELSMTSLETVYIDVLGNDTDPDGDQLTILNATPSFGEVAIVDDKLNFTPPTGFKGAIKIPYTITDEVDNTATAEVTVLVNVQAGDDMPVITVPQDLCGPLSLPANELYTKVDYGNASAVDQFRNTLPVSVIDNVTRFAPGANIVYWQATDSDGNTTIAAQRVCVDPLVSLAKDQTVIEGESTKVGIFLNGDSPEYPLEVAYTISGTADSSDHTLIDGSVIIEQGTQAMIEFDISDDFAVEGNETIVVTLAESLNRGAKFAHTTTISERNVAPEVTLTVSQDNEERLTITPTGGLVTVNASVYDPNIGDNFIFTWTSEENVLVNQSSEDNKFVFDPVDLATGTYKVSLTVEDNGLPMGDDNEFIFINVQPELVALSDADSDGDNIPDYLEGYKDSDGDGIFDYLDRIDECNVLLEEEAVQDGFLVEGDPGVCLRRGSITFAGETGGAHITENDVANTAGGIVEDPIATNIGGIFDFISYGLPDEAQSVAITLPQRNPVPRDAVYRKFNGTEWVFFVEDELNTIHSTQGEPGYCPPPRSEMWTPGLTEGHWCVQVEIEDGGPNDDDMTVNGTVEDPGFVGVLTTQNTLPEADDLQRNIEFNDTVTIDLNEFVSDADGDELTVTSVTPEVGTFELVDNVLTYIPPQDFSGTVELIYAVIDSSGGTTFATITIVVGEPNYPPQPGPLAPTAIEQCSPSQPIDVLSVATDAENDALRVVSASSPNGTVEILEDGGLVFNPDCDFYGTATITYVIEDEAGNQTTGRFTQVVKQVIEVIAVTDSTGGSTSAILLGLLALVIVLRKTKMQYKLLTLCSALLLSVQAQAREKENEECHEDKDGVVICETLQWPTGFYVGAQAGYVSTDVNMGQLDSMYQSFNIDATSTSIEDSDASYGINIGHQLSKYVALQYGYQNFGHREVVFSGSTLAENIDAFWDSAEEVYPVSAKGRVLSLIGSLPLTERIKVSAKLGYFDWTRNYETLDPALQGDASTKGRDWIYGVSASYLFSQKFVLNLGYDWTEIQGQDMANVFLGVSYFPFAENEKTERKREPIQAPIAPVVVEATPADDDMDGVINSLDECPNSEKNSNVDEVGCAAKVVVKEVYLNVLFELNSSILTEDDKQKIAEFAVYLAKNPGFTVVIEGHTDSRGSEKYNQFLSENRAKAVTNWLIEAHGIAADRIDYIGYGETRLLSAAQDEAAHQANRRVVAKITN